MSLAALAFASNVKADDGDGSNTITTWHGANVDTIQITETNHEDDVAKCKVTKPGTKFYLYNVGLGKFVSLDEDYNCRPMLKYRSHGTPMTLGFANNEADCFKVKEKKANLIYTDQSNFYGSDSDHPETKDRGKYLKCLGVNLPKYTSSHKWGDEGQVYGPIMDTWVQGDVDDYTYRHFHFIRVDADKDPEGTYTYRILEEIRSKGQKGYKYEFLGAKAGHPDGDDPTPVAFPEDRMTFQEVFKNGNVNDNTFNNPMKTEEDEKGADAFTLTKVKESDFFKWRFVTEDEMKAIATAQDADMWGGLLANVSYLISDPYFDNGRDDEFGKWNVEGEGTTGDNTKLYKWAGKATETPSQVDVIEFGTSSNTQGYFTAITPWDKPQIHKIQFSDSQTDEKYGYAIFDGKGEAYQTINVPAEGYYMVTLHGFTNTDDGKLFARGSEGEATATLEKVTAFTKTLYANDQSWSSYRDGEKIGATPSIGNTHQDYLYYSSYENAHKNENPTLDEYKSYTGTINNGLNQAKHRVAWKFATGQRVDVRNMGAYLYNNNESVDTDNKKGSKFTKEVIVYVAKGGTLTFGVKKDATNPGEVEKLYQVRTSIPTFDSDNWSKNTTSTTTTYKYDKNYIAFDNVNIYYMGVEKPFLLNEETSVTSTTGDGYVEKEFKSCKEKATAATDTDTKKRYTNRTIYLYRTFQPNVWNSFVSPTRMTCEQVLEYFGADTKVCELNGVNTMSSTSEQTVIDFSTVPLQTSTPLDEGVTISATRNAYAIYPGKMYIVKPSLERSDDYTFENFDKKTYMIGRHDFTKDVPTPNNTYTGKASSAGDKLLLNTNGTYYQLNAGEGPDKDSYVFASTATESRMYRLTGPMSILGFRAWLTATDEVGHAKQLTFAIDSEDATTFIDGVYTKPATTNSGNIYTLNGQLVRANAQTTDGLQPGIYIQNGKKVVVK